jgi:oxygen-dependent protoporphyrinogen oxidase
VSAVPHVAIVGGGISGLATAHRLVRLTSPGALRVSVLESSERFGGVVRTRALAGRLLDAGPESMLAAAAQGPALCRELGLGDELVAPACDQPLLWTRGALRPLPPRLLAGVPGGARAVAATGTLSKRGMLRAGLDYVLPSREPVEDVSIGSLVRARLGDEVHERLIAPLLGGIHAGDCDSLSVRAAAPQLVAALASGRGLIRGLRALAAKGPARGAPVFLTLDGGLATLVTALVEELAVRCELRGATAVTSIAPAGGRLELMISGGERLLADRVALATPAYATAEILAAACPAGARELRKIDYASVATVALAYPAAAFGGPLRGSGFLVPRGERRTITACTWASAKWAHLAGEPLLLRASVGHAGDASALEHDDTGLIALVHAELAAAMALRAGPLEAAVTRFPAGLAQYHVGHLERVARIEAALAGLPGVNVAGAAYRGVGIGSCIRGAEALATQIAGELGFVPQPSLQKMTTRARRET